MRKQVLTLVDGRRRYRRGDGSIAARRLITVVRYPERRGTAGPSRGERVPLVVFAHGFALTPRRYRKLLHGWAQAGYVVAAPVFPGERAGAPGGPNRGDLLNEPADLRFVVDRLIAAAGRSTRGFASVLDPRRIAVAGHSDGGDAALAVGYDPRFRSRRADAVIVLAGADLPGIPPFRFPADGPPLLAVQGGRDAINPPAATSAFYARARPPKLLLTFPRAGHSGPYMTQRPELAVLGRVTIAFLDRTLKGARITRRELVKLGTRRRVSTMR